MCNALGEIISNGVEVGAEEGAAGWSCVMLSDIFSCMVTLGNWYHVAWSPYCESTGSVSIASWV